MVCINGCVCVNAPILLPHSKIMGNQIMEHICWRGENINIDPPMHTLRQITPWSSGTPTSTFNNVFPREDEPLRTALSYLRENTVYDIPVQVRQLRIHLNGSRLGYKPFKIKSSFYTKREHTLLSR